MKLNSNIALNLLNNCKGMADNDSFIEHSILVGDVASLLACALNLDSDLAKTLGYIHDIGRKEKNGWTTLPHEIIGYEYIKSLGYDEEYARICLLHSYLNNDINCVSGGIPDKNHPKYNFLKDYVENHEYTIYEKIITMSDLMCKQNVMTLEQRLIELMTRYGVFENTVYNIKECKKLKEYFDSLLGYNLYDLFPDIKNNL